MKPKPEVAVGYIRVSTNLQRDSGVSLDAQSEKIKSYCQLHDLKLLSTEVDAGISGKRADNRPGLQTAISLACKHKAVIVFYSLSRFARSAKDCIDLSHKIQKCGANLASITESIDTTSSMGRFFFKLMAAIGELESEQTSERTDLAFQHMRTQKRKLGRYPAYGWKQINNTLVQDPSEQTTLELVRSMLQDGSSLRQVATHLNDNNIKPRGGEIWYASSIKSVLKTNKRRVDALQV